MYAEECFDKIIDEYKTRIEELESENEELKREIMKEQTIRVCAEKDAGKLYEENARLKETINTAEQMLNKSILLPIKPYDFHIEYDLVDIKILPTENRKIVGFPVYVYFDYDDYKKLKKEFDKIQEK